MGSSKGFYRSSNGLIGGVCAGFAEHFGLDTLPVRLIFVLLLVASLGIAAVLYLILYLKWPLRENNGAVCEIKPHTVDSSAYGALSYESIDRMGVGHRHRADAPLSVGHIPPLPPRSFVELYGTATAPYFRYFSRLSQSASAPIDRERPAHIAPIGVSELHLDGGILFLVALAVFCLTAFLDYLLTQCSPNVTPMSCLPLFFVLVGIGIVVVPNHAYPVLGRIAHGFGFIVCGAFVTAVSTGVLSASMLHNPYLIVTFVFLLLTAICAALRPRTEFFVMLLCLIAVFAGLAFGSFAQPGPLTDLSFSLPGSDIVVMHVNPWA